MTNLEKLKEVMESTFHFEVIQKALTQDFGDGCEAIKSDRCDELYGCVNCEYFNFWSREYKED